MYRRKRRILKSLVLGFAVAAFVAPAALAEPRGAGNPDTAGNKVADTSPAISSTDLMRLYGSKNAVDSDAAGKADTSPAISSADLMRLYGSKNAVSSNPVGSPDDRNLYRGVETPNAPTFSPAIRGEHVKSLDRPSFDPVSQPTVTVSNDDGFQWVDVGFGAASTLALVLLMGAAALLIRNQRRRIAVY